MIASFITRNGETLALLLARPDRTTKPEVSCTLPTDIAWHPISRVESRRVFAGSVRYSMKYKARFSNAADATEMRMWLNRLHEGTVAVPSWPDRCLLTADVPSGGAFIDLHDHPVRFGAEWIICASDFSSYEIVVVFNVAAHRANLSAPTLNPWPAGSLAYPLMFGRLTERPELTAYTPERAVCDFKIQENSPFARRLNPFPIVAVTLGDVGQSNVATLPLWNIEPNHVQLLDKTTIDTIYQRIGFGRVDYAKTWYYQQIPRGFSMQFFARDRDDIAKIEGFFFGRRGTTRSFMLPTFRGDLRLTSDLPVAGATTRVPVEPSEFLNLSRPSHPGDPWIALVDPASPVPVEPHKLVSYSSVNLQAFTPVIYPHAMRNTRVSHLCMVRFADSSLTWAYHSDGKATCTIKFVELPNDYDDGGLSLKEPVYLYRIVKEATGEFFYFTSYENNFRGHIPADFSHGDIESGIDLSQEKVEIESSPFPGNPLLDWFPFVAEGRYLLTISEGNAANPAELPTVRFSGEIWDFDKKNFKATCVAFGRFFEGKFPAFLLQTLDNEGVFDGPRALNPAAWLVTGTITAKSTQLVNLASAAGAGKDAEWFSWGWLDTGAGTTRERRTILHSHPIAGGISLAIDRPLLQATNGQLVNLYPGYDGSIQERDQKFGDRIDHQGHPYAPDTPPNIKVLKTKTAPGGKKG